MPALKPDFNYEPQEAFDIMVTHLRQQGMQAISEGGLCQYKTPDGLMCAVGCLIHPDVYAEDMEGEQFDDALAAVGITVLEDLEHILGDMQETHDNWLPDSWEDRFALIATRHGLNLQPLEKA